ncbi:MAG: DNA mismatch repair endonuclease MutL [Ignavibacteriales bacterium]|nr:DNA mismatch repair endonuclease MutL [Ignavibacteriales bacterium]
MKNNVINILPDFIANKIAAGEVVQRPESVLKELMENSIDAGAKNIEVFIKRAGSVLVQVIDDGIGMNEKDAVLSIKRHATSKINSIEDLNNINTFGFRGEALSSIAAVSIFELKTEMKENEIGVFVKVENDELKIEKGSFPKGTSISVKNLFYNTPARRNFLKSYATELKHLLDTFKKISLSNPSIGFKLWNDDEMIFDFKISDMDERMSAVFADNILDGVIKVEEIIEFITVKGYVSKPTYLTKSKSDQYLYINKRFVVNKSINHAVFNAYDDLLEKGDYPFFVLFIDLDPKKIDVNVHPSKLEVKFENEKDIYNFIRAVVKKGLGQYDLIPNIELGEKNSGTFIKNNYENPSNKNDFSDRPAFITQTGFKNEKPKTYSDSEIDLLFNSLNTNIKNSVIVENSDHPFEEKIQQVYHSPSSSNTDDLPKGDTTFIVALHNKYILTPIKTGLMIIDAHVAHERILYEKAINSFEANLPFTQQLLFAQTIQLDPADYLLVKELEPHLIKLGFALKFFSKNVIVIEGVPSDINVGSEVETFLDILNEYKTNEIEKHLEQKDNLAKSFSCKAAIKAGDKLNEREMRILIDQLFATSMPYVCPHGRPVIVKIPLTEFDKRFGRT